MNNGVLGKYESVDGIHTVILEDDGRVAYGYLLELGVIVSDVWLYNRVPAPTVPEWKSPVAEMPFVNSYQYVANDSFTYVTSISEFSVDWGIYDENRIAALIRIRGKIHALLVKKEKPGYCLLSKKNGPLAKCLTKEIIHAFK